MNIQELAYLSHCKSKKIAKSQGYGFDVFTILTIVNIIVQIVKIVMKLYGSKERAANGLASLGAIKKFVIWKVVQKNCKDKDQANLVYEGIMDSLSSLSNEELVELLSDDSYKKGKLK